METKYTYPNERKLKALKVRIPVWLKSVSEICLTHDLDEERMKVLLHQFFLSYLKNSKMKRWHSKRGNFLDDYFPVSSVLLKETCTTRYIGYVKALMESGVIDRRETITGGRAYVVGGHAQLYRWKLPMDYEGPIAFRTDRVTGYKQVKSVLATRDRYARQSKQSAKEYSKENPIYETLLAHLDDMRFDDAFTEEYEKFKITDDLKFLQAEALSNKDFQWFSRDDFGCRLHHPVAALPKDYRNRLRFKSNPETKLVVLDIKNSQPYFSSVFLNKHLITTHLPEFLPGLPSVVKYERTGDFILYRRLCVEGRLYEFIMEGMGLNIKNKNERDKIKELLFSSVLFSRLRVYGEKKRFRDYFRSIFPNVFEMFQSIKRMDEELLPDLKDVIRPRGAKFKYANSNNAYKLVSCLMQRAESAIMYNVIAPKLVAQGVKFVTVHDSFILLPEAVEFVKDIIKESFDELGLPVPVFSEQSS